MKKLLKTFESFGKEMDESNPIDTINFDDEKLNVFFLLIGLNQTL